MSSDDALQALIRDLTAAICQAPDRPPPAHAVYRALCAAWQHDDGLEVALTWRHAADVTYELVGADCYLAGGEGVVAGDLRELLAARGWMPR